MRAVTVFVSITQVSLPPEGSESGSAQKGAAQVFSSDHTVIRGKASSFDDAVFLHTGLASELNA